MQMSLRNGCALRPGEKIDMVVMDPKSGQQTIKTSKSQRCPSLPQPWYRLYPDVSLTTRIYFSLVSIVCELSATEPEEGGDGTTTLRQRKLKFHRGDHQNEAQGLAHDDDGKGHDDDNTAVSWSESKPNAMVTRFLAWILLVFDLGVASFL